MGGILALALAAAVYPQLLAVVVVILTRPNPRPLLWGCYLGSVVISLAASAAVLAVFDAHDRLLGTSSTSLGPGGYLVIGGLTLLLSVLAATPRGRELLGRDRPWRRAPRGPSDGEPGRSTRMKARLEQSLRDGSLFVAFLVGAFLGIPGPFDLLALGRLARDGYSHVTMAVTVVVFILIKFLAIEVPIASYALRPQGTAAAVERFAGWMQANKLEIVAAVAGVISLVLIGRGVAGLH